MGGLDEGDPSRKVDVRSSGGGGGGGEKTNSKTNYELRLRVIKGLLPFVAVNFQNLSNGFLEFKFRETKFGAILHD